MKQRIAVMFGLKQFSNAVITIAGIELMHRIRKGSSGYDVLAFSAELRPQSGTQCSEPECYTAHQARAYRCRLLAPEPAEAPGRQINTSR